MFPIAYYMFNFGFQIKKKIIDGVWTIFSETQK